jgi:hypothetical protein
MKERHDQLATMLEASLQEASENDNAEVRSDRARNHIYYSGEPFGNEQKNGSKHVSMDVLDSAEAKKAYYMESLLGSRKVCRFQPSGPNDLDMARARTAYASEVFEENDGFELIEDALHDAFIAKRCVARVNYEKTVRTKRVTKIVPPQVLAAMEQDPAITILAIERMADGSIGVEAEGRVESGYWDFTLVQPEHFLRDGNAARIKDAQHTHEIREYTRGQLVEMGYDPELVQDLTHDTRHYTNEEDFARTRQRGTSTQDQSGARSDERGVVTTYLSHIYLDADHAAQLLQENRPDSRDIVADMEPGDYKLFRIVWGAPGIILEAREEPDGLPYFEWTEYKISHAQHGLADADVMAPLQKTTSSLVRGIVNNQAAVNNPRWIAQHKMIRNPRDLLDNTLAAVIWENRPGSIREAPTPSLSPASFQALEMMAQEKEQRSGLSRLSKGMNQDALSHQNADRMIERLTNASNRRVMKGVRSFAQTFLRPMLARIVELGAKYDKQPREVEVAGKWTTIIPSQLGSVGVAQVAVAITPEECAKAAQNLLMMHQIISQDPVAGPLYGVQQRHALYEEVYELLGVPDTSKFMMSPDSPEFAQMVQSMQAQQQQQAQQAAMFQQFQQWLAQSADRREWTKTQADIQKGSIATAIDAEGMDLEERKFEHKKTIDKAEIDIERSQRRGTNIGASD